MKVAIAQLRPVFLDRVRTTARIVEWIDRAAGEGCQLVAFGESVLPAYPLWICRTDGARFDAPDQKQLHALYLEQAVVPERGDLDPIRDAARRGEIQVVVGIAERPLERGGHSLFCSRVVIDARGEIASIHRKLMPTYEERLAWAPGDAAGLVTHPAGEFTLGALNCWENWMPLARAALYAQGVDLHVALWPGSEQLTESLTRFVAREARAYVLSASAVVTGADVPDGLPARDRMGAPDELLYDGGSCIAGPDGRWVVEPVVGREELVTAELSFRRVLEERQNFDPAGHYSRPELLRLQVDGRRPKALERLDFSE